MDQLNSQTIQKRNKFIINNNSTINKLKTTNINLIKFI
jgi:hypothetical protein